MNGHELPTKMMHVPSYVKLPEGKSFDYPMIRIHGCGPFDKAWKRTGFHGHGLWLSPMYSLVHVSTMPELIINQPGFFKQYIPISLMVKPWYALPISPNAGWIPMKSRTDRQQLFDYNGVKPWQSTTDINRFNASWIPQITWYIMIMYYVMIFYLTNHSIAVQSPSRPCCTIPTALLWTMASAWNPWWAGTMPRPCAERDSQKSRRDAAGEISEISRYCKVETNMEKNGVYVYWDLLIFLQVSKYISI